MKKRTIALAVIAVAAMALTGSLTTSAAAQSDAARAIYQSAATIQTNIAGIHTYPAPPANFKPLEASDETLAMYGFPPRPDKTEHPEAYAHWSRAMLLARNRVTGDLKPHPEVSNGPAILNKKQRPQISGTAAPTQYESSNWSGVANGNTLTKWNTKTSFSAVYSEFNVPVVQQAFDVCDGGTDWEVSWNGIDGTSSLNDTVLQGGSSSQAICKSNKTSQVYYAWVEWWPSYSITEVFPVNPGDDMFVETYDTAGGCNPGNVYVEDETTLAYGTFQITWITGPCLVGRSAEFIVERPGNSNGLFPLANYIWDFALSWDYDLKGTEFNPGSTSPSTLIFTMMDDNYDTVISVPEVEGKYSLFFYDTGCAYTGGCVR
ncbi:MAG: G1 family glutamic endopeptidase [Terriglobales bacterium]